jgi:hypothetical protein
MTPTKKETPKPKGEKIGFAEFGAFLHRNDGGKVNISAYTSVNEPLKVLASADTQRIAHRRFNIFEEEVAALDGRRFYSKDVWTDQEEASKPSSGQNTPESSPYTGPQGAGGTDKVDYLKNMHDQLDNRETAHDLGNKSTTNAIWITVVAVAIIAAVALVIAVV